MKNEPEFSLEVKWIDTEKDKNLEDAFKVRREVFIKEQKVPEEEEFDEADSLSYHIIVYAAERPIATGRLYKKGENWLIGRIAVLKEFRGIHARKLIVEKLMEKAAEIEAVDVYIHAQTHAVSFYEKFGFVAYGDIFLEANIEHISMVKKMGVL